MFGAEVIGVHVGDKTEKKEKELQGLLNESPVKDHTFKTFWQKGEPVDVILNIANEQAVDLLILGAIQKENLFKYYVGSIARKLTRKAKCSVLLLIKPSTDRIQCNHIVVNGLKDEKTQETLKTAFKVSQDLGCKRVTIVEEISQTELKVKVSDDATLRKSTIAKERLKTREDLRVNHLLKDIDTTDIIVKTQSIFGQRGYSIGHYAKVKRADLLVMNAPSKMGILDRIFPHDIEHILAELPTDVLIVK
ncbi:universal stress protein [Tenacibaculum sp. S7007]|uniref:Universal stress protein n=2 Tax=Tenacibaculum pelagium TaxID=2759527 RepID=A0A839AND2_9FLAO|nr:universal stress protein [Tenacibaculum pelagium]